MRAANGKLFGHAIDWLPTASDGGNRLDVNIAHFGPSLVLARELLKAGETEAVLDYLDKLELLCGFGQRESFSLSYEIATGKQIDPGCLY